MEEPHKCGLKSSYVRLTVLLSQGLSVTVHRSQLSASLESVSLCFYFTSVFFIINLLVSSGCRLFKRKMNWWWHPEMLTTHFKWICRPLWTVAHLQETTDTDYQRNKDIYMCVVLSIKGQTLIVQKQQHPHSLSLSSVSACCLFTLHLKL